MQILKETTPETILKITLITIRFLIQRGIAVENVWPHISKFLQPEAFIWTKRSTMSSKRFNG